MENEEQPKITIDQLAGMMADGFAEMREQIDTSSDGVREEMKTRFASVDKRLDVLNQKIDPVDAKLDQHRQETKADHATLRGVVGGLSHNLADHEERIKALEGE
jgi:hypothetical protein